MSIAVCALLMAGPLLPQAAASPVPSPLGELRAEAERILYDFAAGRNSAIEARFVDEMRPKAAASVAALARLRGELGGLERLHDARVFADARVDGHPAIVLDADVRFSKTAAVAEFAFVRDAGPWRLRGFTLFVVEGRPPLADAGVPAAARTLLEQAQRRGLVALSEAIPPIARGETEAGAQAALEGPQSLLGRLKSFRLGPVDFAWYRCRSIAAESGFEHGDGAVLFSLCPHAGAWRPFSVEVKPVITPELFERTVALVVSKAKPGRDVSVRCPAALVPVGGTATCRLTSGGRTTELRVRRTTSDGIEVEGLE